MNLYPGFLQLPTIMSKLADVEDHHNHVDISNDFISTLSLIMYISYTTLQYHALNVGLWIGVDSIDRSSGDFWRWRKWYRI